MTLLNKNQLLLILLLFCQITISQSKLLYGSRTGLREGNSSGEDLKTILNQIDDVDDFEYYDNTLFWINNQGLFYLDVFQNIELITDDIDGDHMFIHNDLVYFTSYNEIKSYHITNGVIETVFSLDNSDSFKKMEFDTTNEKIFFQNELSFSLFNIDIDGSNFEVVIPLVHDFALSDNNIYWVPSDEGDSTLFRSSNLFGTATVEITEFLYNKNWFREISAVTSGGIEYIYYIYKFTSTNPIEIIRYNVNSSTTTVLATQQSGISNFEHIYPFGNTYYYYETNNNEANQIHQENVAIVTTEINEDSNLDFTDSNILVSLNKQINRYDYEGDFENVLLDRNSFSGDIANFTYNENTNTSFWAQDDRIFKYETGATITYDIYTIQDNVSITHMLLTNGSLYWKEFNSSTLITKIKSINQSANNESGVITHYDGDVDHFVFDLVFYDGEFYGILSDGVVKFNFSTNTEDYIEFDENSLYDKISIYDDKIFLIELSSSNLEDDSIIKMNIDGSNKEIVLNDPIMNAPDYKGIFAFEGDSVDPNDPPNNNDCETAINLNVGTTFDENFIVASNENATPSFENSCNAYTADNDVWYSVTIPNTGHLILETKSNSDIVDDTHLIIYEGDCDNLTAVYCNFNLAEDDFSKVIIDDDPGKTFYVRSIDNDNGLGSYKLSAYTSVTGPIGDVFSNPINLVVGTDFEAKQRHVSMIDYTASGIFTFTTCGNSTIGEDVWFTASIPDSGEINIEVDFITNVSGIIPVMNIYTGTTSELATYVTCTDNSIVTLQGPANTLLFIRVNDFSNQNLTGAFRISAYHESVLNIDDDFNLKTDLKLYPNPVSDQLTIESRTIIDTIEIFDINGRLLNSEQVPNSQLEHQLNVSKLPQGIYFIKIQSGDLKETKKFIKK